MNTRRSTGAWIRFMAITGSCLVLSVPVAFGQTGEIRPGIQEDAGSLAAMASWANVLAILVAIVTALAAIVVGLAAFHSLTQHQRSKEVLETLRADHEAKIKDIEDRYHLAQLKKPGEILADVRAEFDPRLEVLRGLLEHSNSDLRERLAALQESAARSKGMEERVYRKVLNAFLQLSTLSGEERQRISSQLSADDDSENA